MEGSERIELSSPDLQSGVWTTLLTSHGPCLRLRSVSFSATNWRASITPRQVYMYWSEMRESHPLGPEGFGFTDRRPYFKALISVILAQCTGFEPASPSANGFQDRSLTTRTHCINNGRGGRTRTYDGQLTSVLETDAIAAMRLPYMWRRRSGSNWDYPEDRTA